MAPTRIALVCLGLVHGACAIDFDTRPVPPPQPPDGTTDGDVQPDAPVDTVVTDTHEDAADEEVVVAPEHVDNDGDGFCEVAPCSGDGVMPGDCRDVDASRNPGRHEVCGTDFDEDCDGESGDPDNDGDGALDAECGGTDCDDHDAAVHPMHAEVRDGKDNDCDGLWDEGLVEPGDVIVTEVMCNPAMPVVDDQGEWFEVRNVSRHRVNLEGWVISDAGTDSYRISAPGGVPLDPGEWAVFARNGDEELNGGIEADHVYDGIMLANTQDEILLSFEGVVIDEVFYGPTGWPSVEGASMNLDARSENAEENDWYESWCNSPTDFVFGSSQRGTPGRANADCEGGPVVGLLTPDRGQAAGGASVVLEGNRLSDVTEVWIRGYMGSGLTVVDDRTLQFLSAIGDAGWADVEVVTGTGAEFTLVDGWVFWGTNSDVSFCAIQYPRALEGEAGLPSPQAYARVYHPTITEEDGQGEGMIAQIGFGTLDSDPRTAPSWKWREAEYFFDLEDDDVYGGTLVPTVAGTYSYAFRFSRDGGYAWVYCDLDEGLADGFDPLDAGTFTVY